LPSLQDEPLKGEGKTTPCGEGILFLEENFLPLLVGEGGVRSAHFY